MKRWIKLLCAIVMAIAVALPAAPAALAAGEAEQRIINVVYDNSGSMYGPTNDRWSQALYAMEVFATMLDSGDEMNLFLMDDHGGSPKTVAGSDPDRVEALVSEIRSRISGGTPYETVENAYAQLQNESDTAARWLVVLTDGDFNSAPYDLQGTMESYTQSGVNVVYLALGSDATPLNSSGSFYAYQETDSSAILSSVTAIANQIFQQQILPANHITTTGSTMTLDIDIPVSKLMVFAQGENISVDSLSLNGSPISPTGKNAVEVTAGDTASDEGGSLLAGGLCGLVQTYAASGDPYAKGTYELTVSDTSNVQVYYVAGAEIDCCLVDENGVTVTSDETHYAGTYGIQWAFLDPLTGETLDSDLLDGAEFRGRMTLNGEVKDIDPSVTTVALTEGELELEAVAELPGNVTVHSPVRQYTVYPDAIQLNLSAQAPGDGYKLSALGPEAEPITVTVTNRETGEKLSQEEWEAIGTDHFLVKGDTAGVNWLVTLGSEVSTWEIRPDYITDMSDTASGPVNLTMTAEYEIDNQYAAGSGTLSVNIADYVSSELKVELAAPAAVIDLNDLDSAQPVQVTLYTKDEYTGEYIPLTQEQSDAVQLEVQASDLDWSLTPGNLPGTWNLTPTGGADGLLSSISQIGKEVQVNVVVSGVLEEDGLLYEGSGSTGVPVRMLDAAHLVAQVLPYVIGFAVFLFFFLGYLCKKKLRLKNMHPRVTNKKTHPAKTLNVKIKRKWYTYLLPWIAQQAVVYSHQTAFNCRCANVVIKAAGGNNFYITNLKSYTGKSYRIDGDLVEVQEMKHKKFNMATTITCYGKDTKVAGEFSFS